MDQDMENLHLDEGRSGPADMLKKIKNLEYENIQLRVRIYMNEQQMNGEPGLKSFEDVKTKNALVAEYMLMKKLKEEAEQKVKECRHGHHEPQNVIQTENEDYDEKITAMTKALYTFGNRCVEYEEEKKYLQLKIQKMESNFTKLMESKNRELEEEKRKVQQLKMQLERSQSEIHMLRSENEKQMAQRQDEVHSRQISNLVAGNENLRGRLSSSEEALRSLYEEHIKLATELKTLKANYVAQLHKLGHTNEAPVGIATQRAERLEPNNNNSARHNLSSPDLGIGLESGQEAQTENTDDADISTLRKQKSQLVQKLNQARQDLYKTGARLQTTTKHREQVERAVCRQLHKTHSILKEARLNMEQKISQQVLTDLNGKNPH